METERRSIEKIRAAHEEEIMAIPGVVSVAEGLDEENRPCLRIGTAVPVEQVRPLLPKALERIHVELVYFGDIDAQGRP